MEVRHRGCLPPRYGGRDCSQLPGDPSLAMEISKLSLTLGSYSRTEGAPNLFTPKDGIDMHYARDAIQDDVLVMTPI